MGPIWPVAGGWASGDSSGLWILVLFLVAVALLVRILPALTHLGGERGDAPVGRQGRGTPEGLLGERYARGEIGWPEYREGLVSLLKERYVRGELEVGEYEGSLARLLEEPPIQRESARPAPRAPEVVPVAPAVRYLDDPARVDRDCAPSPCPPRRRRGC